MRETAAAGLLRLGIWRIGGTPVAAQLWILELGTATVLKLAHDEAFHADSPGTVLTALMLRTLLDGAQVDTIDFGRGDDAYKQGWASQRRQRIGVVLVNPRRPAGMAFLARHKLGRARGWLQAWRPRIAGGPRAVRQPDALEQLPQRQAVRSCASTSRVMPITGSSARWQAPIGIHDCRHAGGKVVGHEPSSAMTTGRGDPGSSRIVAFAGAPRLAGVTQHGER
jgi:hypothetical protein